MYCKNCGKEIDDKAYLCPHCGVVVQDAQPVDNDKDKDLKQALNVTLTLISVIGGLAFISFLTYFLFFYIALIF